MPTKSRSFPLGISHTISSTDRGYRHGYICHLCDASVVPTQDTPTDFRKYEAGFLTRDGALIRAFNHTHTHPLIGPYMMMFDNGDERYPYSLFATKY